MQPGGFDQGGRRTAIAAPVYIIVNGKIDIGAAIQIDSLTCQGIQYIVVYSGVLSLIWSNLSTVYRTRLVIQVTGIIKDIHMIRFEQGNSITTIIETDVVFYQYSPCIC